VCTLLVNPLVTNFETLKSLVYRMFMITNYTLYILKSKLCIFNLFHKTEIKMPALNFKLIVLKVKIKLLCLYNM